MSLISNICAIVKTRYLGMATSHRGNPCNGYLNPYWVDDHLSAQHGQVSQVLTMIVSCVSYHLV